MLIYLLPSMVKEPRNMPWRAQRGRRGIALLFQDLSARWVCVVSVTPRSPLPSGKTRYPFYRRLGGLQDRSEQVRKISPPPGFDPQTVQPVGSRYTDYATRPISSHFDHLPKTRISEKLYLPRSTTPANLKALPLGKRPSTHCPRSRVDLRAGLDRCGKSRPHKDSIPGPSSL